MRKRVALCAMLAVLGIAAAPIAAYAETSVVNWGINNQDSLALGWESQSEPSPQTVLGLSGTPVYVTGGWHDGYAIMEGGTVQAWGDNAFGQIGDGTRETKTSPVEVSGLHNVTAISVSGYHAVALSEGKVYAWGTGQAGEYGDGSSGLKEGCGKAPAARAANRSIPPNANPSSSPRSAT